MRRMIESVRVPGSRCPEQKPKLNMTQQDGKKKKKKKRQHGTQTVSSSLVLNAISSANVGGSFRIELYVPYHRRSSLPD